MFFMSTLGPLPDAGADGVVLVSLPPQPAASRAKEARRRGAKRFMPSGWQRQLDEHRRVVRQRPAIEHLGASGGVQVADEDVVDAVAARGGEAGRAGTAGVERWERHRSE